MPSLLTSPAIPETQLSVAAASITASYTVVGSFTAPIVMGWIISTLDQAVQLSLDGVHDHIAVPIGNTTPAVIPLDLKTNRLVLGNPSFSVKRIGTPTTGSLYICGFSAAFA